MRNAGLLAAAATLAVILASFAPVSWKGAPGEGPRLGSVSPTELTLAAKDLPMGASYDAH
jgi:hypothetical protein